MAAFALGSLLVHDAADGAAVLADADRGDDVRVQGELRAFDAPAGWDAVRPFLQETTYRLDVEGLDALVLVSGLEPGLAPQTVVVEGALIHSGAHPDEPGRAVFVVAGTDVREPVLFR